MMRNRTVLVIAGLALSGCGGSTEGGVAEPQNFGPEPPAGNDVDFGDESSDPVFGRDEPSPTGSPGQPQPQVLEGQVPIEQCADLQDDVCALCLCVGSLDCDPLCNG